MSHFRAPVEGFLLPAKMPMPTAPSSKRFRGLCKPQLGAGLRHSSETSVLSALCWGISRRGFLVAAEHRIGSLRL